MKRNSIVTPAMLLKLAGAMTLGLTLLIGNGAFAGTPINETRSAKAGGSVWVHNLAGTVKIHGWSKNEVHVSGTLGNGAKRLEISTADDGIDIRVVLPENSHNNIEGTDLVIDVPTGSRLSVNTVSADIEADNVDGTAQFKSVSGEIRLTSRDRDIVVSSISGDMQITGSAANAHINAHGISNDLRLSNLDGDLQAETISGTVKVSGKNHLSRASLSSTSGNVEFRAPLSNQGSYTFNSTSGNILLSVPAKPDARFDISTFSGNIDNRFGPKPQRTSEYGPGMELHFTSGAGSAQVNARTLSGNINLRTE